VPERAGGFDSPLSHSPCHVTAFDAWRVFSPGARNGRSGEVDLCFSRHGDCKGGGVLDAKRVPALECMHEALVTEDHARVALHPLEERPLEVFEGHVELFPKLG
jgi:hypothetical protein